MLTSAKMSFIGSTLVHDVGEASAAFRHSRTLQLLPNWPPVAQFITLIVHEVRG